MPVSTIVLLVIVGVAVAWYASRNMRGQIAARSAVAALPVMTAQTPVADGSMVRVIGTVRMLEQLVAPLSGRPCVAYRTVCKLQGAVGTHEAQAAGDLVQEQTAMFALDRPGDSPVIIDGSHVRIDIPSLPFGAMSGAAREQFLTSRNVSIRYATYANWTEQVVEVGAQVSVAGTVMHDGGNPGEMYRDGGAQVRMVGNAQFPLTINRA
ncbi:MAG TPA: hypothetical protein VGM90_26235 [Kofleriaceae bacterium]|jgi:hypothetical protein